MTATGLATIELFESQDGGLRNPFPSGTRSLLISFDDAVAGETLGVVIEVFGNGELVPGSSYTVRLLFWSDVARIYGSAGAGFLSVTEGRSVEAW
jgi:hypothetical protein